MNSKLQLYTYLATLLTIVNSLAIENVEDIKLNDPNVKYSKKLSSSGSKVTKASGKLAKYLLLLGIVIITIIILTCICCCLGCCSCLGGKKSKKDKVTINTSKPYGSEPEVVTVQPPQPPPQAYNPVYPSYGAPAEPGQPGSYPHSGAPYGQSIYPNV